MKNFDEETWIVLIERVRDVLGRERLLNLLPQQDRLISNSLARTLERHEGNMSTITDDEIWETYERITEDVYPSWIKPYVDSFYLKEENGGNNV